MTVAVLLDQAAIGLAREEGLGDAGHAERIDQAGEDREETIMTIAGLSCFSIGGILYARPRAVMAMSIALMPTNGTMMPPRP